MVGRTPIWVTDDFFHVTIPIRDKRRHSMVNKILGFLLNFLVGKKYLKKIDLIHVSWKKMKIKSLESNVNTNCWKKTKSIFLELEYWKYLHVRHNLDVMHIEKNVCESIIGTLFNILGKKRWT